MSEREDIGSYAISWQNISEDIRKAIFSLDAGRVAFLLLKEYSDMSIDEACDAANILIKIYSKQMGHSERVH